MTSAFERLARRIRYGKPIVVVSGLPRSGTSMMMKMLGAGGLPLMTDEIRIADESNPRGYCEYERVKTLDKPGDKSWLKDAQGKAIKIISSLLKDLPWAYNYKVLFMRRHLQEVIASQNAMLAKSGEPAGAASDGEMVVLYEKHLKKASSLLRRQPGIDALEIDYQEVLQDPAGQARRIKRFLGGALDVEKMAGVVEEQLYRNRAGESHADPALRR